jgi:hypothetical protein
MKHEKNIPTQEQNPKGLHQRYAIKKIVPTWERPNNHPERVLVFRQVPVDKGSEYFVMRMDEGGKDINHIKACRIGIHAYADAIQSFIPELANELRERYPLLA